jgi:hypothetical protein
MAPTPKIPEWKRELKNRLLIESMAFKYLYFNDFYNYWACMEELELLKLKGI